MKANLYYSSDKVEYARGVNGQWFYREYGFNGYANAFGRWTPTSEKPPIAFETKVWCDYSRVYRTVKRFRTLGFSKATKRAPNRLRLPDFA